MALQLHTLWPIAESSFQVLVRGRWPARPGALAGDGDSCRTLAGDQLLADAEVNLTHAIGIAAAPEAVWRWLSQMMRGAGIYGWSRLETADCRSADRLIEPMPPPRTGDRLGRILELVDVDAPNEIVWRTIAPVEVMGVPIDDLTLDYRIESTPQRDARLLARLRGVARELTYPLRSHLFDIVDFLLPCAQITTLKTRAEGLIPPPRPRPDRYQAPEFLPAAAPLPRIRI